MNQFLFEVFEQSRLTGSFGAEDAAVFIRIQRLLGDCEQALPVDPVAELSDYG